MSLTAAPSAYPAPGVFECSAIHIDLSCMTPDARIHYTLDGSEPTPESPVYCREDGLLPLRGVHGETVTRVVRACSASDGRERSAPQTFRYRFCCPAKGTYRHQLLREPTADTAGLIRIEDFDLDKLYLVVAHGHPDHIAQLLRFLAAGCRVYLPHADLPVATRFGCDVQPEQVLDLHGGAVLELDNARLRVFDAPGHMPGSVVLLDEHTSDLFSSDAFGSNRRQIPDTAWLQLEAWSIESCLRTLDAFLAASAGRLRRIFTGHNDEILEADRYLAALRRALAKAVEDGERTLVPSLRSAAESFGSGTAVFDGDWRTAPIWAGANVRFLFGADMKAVPPRYAAGFDPELRTGP